MRGCSCAAAEPNWTSLHLNCPEGSGLLGLSDRQQRWHHARFRRASGGLHSPEQVRSGSTADDGDEPAPLDRWGSSCDSDPAYVKRDIDRKEQPQRDERRSEALLVARGEWHRYVIPGSGRPRFGGPWLLGLIDEQPPRRR